MSTTTRHGLLFRALQWLLFPHDEPSAPVKPASLDHSSSAGAGDGGAAHREGEQPPDKIQRRAVQMALEQKRFQFALLSVTLLLFSLYSLLLVIFLSPTVEFTVYASPMSFSPNGTHDRVSPAESESGPTFRLVISTLAVLNCSAFILHHYLRSITITACFFFFYVNGSVWFVCITWGPVGEFLGSLVHVPVLAFFLFGMRAGATALGITLVQAVMYTVACILYVVPTSGNTLKMSITTQMSAIAGTFLLLSLCSALNEWSRMQAVLIYEEAHKRLDEETKAKAHFLANVSHDLRTPLHGIIAASEQLANLIEVIISDDDKPAMRDMCSIVRDSSNHMLALINDVLDLERMDTDRLSIEHVPFYLDREFKKLMQMLKPAAAQKRVSLKCKFLVERCLRIGDSLRFGQVFVNIVSNALKFTPEGGVVSITVASGRALPSRRRQSRDTFPDSDDTNSEGRESNSVETDEVGELSEVRSSDDDEEPRVNSFDSIEDDENLVTVVVQDTGIGIHKDNLPHLFNTFSQAEVSTTRKFGGTGLGLAICKRLCTLMHGRIGATSQAQQGSTFWFTLPLPPATELDEKRYAEHTEGGSIPPALLLEGMRVLLADDNKVNQTLERHILVKAGCEVVMVQDGQEAVRAWEEQGPFDAILMDNHMPVMGGVEATQRIREAERMRDLGRTPILGLSASQQPPSSAGMDEWLTKPIKSSALVAAVKRWAKRSSAAMQEGM